MTLFNRPAWAKASTSEVDDSGENNIFNHADRSYRDIVLEQERRKKEKAERKKLKEERRVSEKRAIEDEPAVVNGGAKKRRITLEDGEALLNSVGLSASAGAFQPILLDDDEGPVRRSPRINGPSDLETPRKALGNTQVIELDDLDDESEEEDITYKAPPPEPEEVDEESDDEFADLARKARRARQQKESVRKAPHEPDISAHSPRPGTGPTDLDHRSQRSPLPDAVIQVFITSRIPNTNPLIVNRKLSQRTREVRLVWCEKQGFSEEMTMDVFFVHRMRRIYDTTTCRSLGLDVDAFGNVIMKGAQGKEDVEKVHLEAVTTEIFQQMKAEREQESKRRSGELPPEEEEGDAQAGAAEGGNAAPEPVQQIVVRLILRAKDRKDFKLVVKPNTQFSKIISAYRKTQGVNESQSVYLEFDGDRLNPDDEVQATEISDMDCVTVHISYQG